MLLVLVTCRGEAHDKQDLEEIHSTLDLERRTRPGHGRVRLALRFYHRRGRSCISPCGRSDFTDLLEAQQLPRRRYLIDQRKRPESEPPPRQFRSCPVLHSLFGSRADPRGRTALSSYRSRPITLDKQVQIGETILVETPPRSSLSRGIVCVRSLNVAGAVSC